MVLYVKMLWDVMAILSLMISDYESAVLTCFVHDGGLFLGGASLLEPVCCQSLVALFGTLEPYSFSF